MMSRVFGRTIVLSFLALSIPSTISANGEKILVFKDSLSYNGHTAAINAAMALLRRLAAANAFSIDTTIHLTSFNTANLAQYAAVMMMYPERAIPSAPATGISDTLNAVEDSALKAFLLSGNAYIGVHCDTRLNNNFPWWYQNFFGSKYVNDIGPQTSHFTVVDTSSFFTRGIPVNFTGNEQLRVDSLYFTQADTNYKVLISGTYSDYPAGQNWMPFFPFVYRHNYQGARMFHIAPGHNATTWTAAPDSTHWNRLFLNGILYALNRPGYGGTTAIVPGSAPKGFSLQRFSDGMGQSLHYGLPQRAHVVVQLFNLQGRMVSRLVDKTFDAGFYFVPLPAGLGGSLYLLDFKAGNLHRTMKIVP